MRELYCITCPAGCKLSVMGSGADISVEGNNCKRGEEFAIAEITNPMRSLTTIVRTSIPGVPVLPVRTDGEIPKGKVLEAMEALRKVLVSSELDCGDTVADNLLGTGVRVIATSDVLKRKDQHSRISKAGGNSGEGATVLEDSKLVSVECIDEVQDEDEEKTTGEEPRLEQTGRARIRGS